MKGSIKDWRVKAYQGVGEVEKGDTGVVIARWESAEVSVRWDKDGQIRRVNRKRLTAVWVSFEDKPGWWMIRHPDGTTLNAGPWNSKAGADEALGYFAWVAAGGSAD